eukprot:452006-Amphidinium_carterae.2
MFGGYHGGTLIFNDLWRLTLDPSRAIGAWQELNAVGPKPPARGWYSSAVIQPPSANPVWVISGGQDWDGASSSNIFHEDVWMLPLPFNPCPIGQARNSTFDCVPVTDLGTPVINAFEAGEGRLTIS